MLKISLRFLYATKENNNCKILSSLKTTKIITNKLLLQLIEMISTYKFQFLKIKKHPAP